MFENEPISTAERISFKVLRTYGLDGAVSVHWRISSTVEIQGDVSPLSGHVGFLTNENEAMIHVDILPDDLPELNEVLVNSNSCLLYEKNKLFYTIYLLGKF